MFEFLTLPERTTKPRESGLTHVLDKGLQPRAGAPVPRGRRRVRRHRQARLGHRRGHAERQGEDRSLPELRHPRVLRRHVLRGLSAPGQVRRVPGARRRVRAWSASRSRTAPSPWTRRTSSPSCASSASSYKVLSEVGSKDEAVVITPSTWVDSIKRELEAGAWKVITEGRESGTVGIYRPTGDVKDGLLEEIRDVVRHHADSSSRRRSRSSRPGSSSSSAPT